MIDEDEPKKPAPRVASPLLDGWGVEELESYIGELRAEIARAEAAIAAKQSHRAAAAAFFRTP